MINDRERRRDLFEFNGAICRMPIINLSALRSRKNTGVEHKLLTYRWLNEAFREPRENERSSHRSAIVDDEDVTCAISMLASIDPSTR